MSALNNRISIVLALLAAGACSAQEPSADAASDVQGQTSSKGLFVVSAVPADGTATVGATESWVLNVRNALGDPVYPASITVGGGMRGHGHGLPTQPQVVAYGGEGDYRVDGMRFNMQGEWTLSVLVSAEVGSDRADIVIDVSPPGVSSTDATWTDRELALLASLTLPEKLKPPAVVSNAYADDARAAAFGETLFFDTRLSGDGNLSCASCHDPDKAFADQLPRSVGAGTTLRNSPSLIGVAFNRWFYWDGRKDSLWAQALIPFEAADEMGGSRLAVLKAIAADEALRDEYESIFGAFPVAAVDATEASHAGPLGSPEMRTAWSAIPVNRQRTLNAAYANLGKSIAAYERTLLPEPTRFDRYVAAVVAGVEPDDEDALSAAEIRGAKLFLDPDRTQCLQCHNGPMLSNGEFHNIGTGNFTGERLDFGRMFGLRAALMDEFNCVGPYSDAEREQCTDIVFLNRDSHLPLRGAFKTPTLRGLADTWPYFHDGRFEDLDDIIDHYVTPPDPAIVGPHELRELDLDDDDRRDLVAFLLSLSGDGSK